MNRAGSRWYALCVTLGALTVLCATEDGLSAAPDPTSALSAKTTKAGPKTVVYYFHGTVRCTTCRTIEAYAEEAVRSAFTAELGNGDVQWQPLNIDEPPNKHFVDDYKLVTRSLVVVDGSDPKRFKNLDKVWTLVRQKDAFIKYVQDEVRAFRQP